MALLGAMAFKALQGSGQNTAQVPLGLVAPKNEAEQRELEQHTELVLKAMINAAKSDGQIDQVAVDTPAEKAYLGQLAQGLGLSAEVTRRIEQMVGLGAA